MFYKFDTAQICENGHVITLAAEYQPERKQAHCLHCGLPTITNCPTCSASIRGARLLTRESLLSVRNNGVEIHVDTNSFIFPKFCIECGAAFPWTEKKIQVLREYIINIDGLSEEDKRLLLTNLDDLIKATPRTDLAVSIWKSVLDNRGNIAKILFEFGKGYWPQNLFN